MAGVAPAGQSALGLAEHLDLAVVVFSGATDLPWLRLLRRGFRHCFVVVRGGGPGQPGVRHWVVIDPLAHALHIEVAPAALIGDAPAIAALYRRRGLVAVIVRRRLPDPPVGLPLRPLTCVEVVKKMVGWRGAGIFTPWQLYRALLRDDESRTEREKIGK